MKKIVTALIPLMIATSASAEVAWVKSPFWQAPYVSSADLKISTSEKNLLDLCKDYREAVEYAPGKTLASSSEIERKRTDGGQLGSNGFVAVFKIDPSNASGEIQKGLAEANDEVQAMSEKDTLPSFTLPTAQLVPTYSPRGDVKVVLGRNTLTGISQSVGLAPARVIIAGEKADAQIRVMGKDLACDIVEGNAVLEYDSSAEVKISLDNQLYINEIYAKVESITNDVFAKKSSVQGRAALFGFRLTEVFGPLRLDNQTSENMVGTITEFLFDAKMQRSTAWKTFNGKNVLSANGTVIAPFKLRLGK
jgi:hypothetical protein